MRLRAVWPWWPRFRGALVGLAVWQRRAFRSFLGRRDRGGLGEAYPTSRAIAQAMTALPRHSKRRSGGGRLSHSLIAVPPGWGR
ncbi:hypothetical protein HYW67_03145 [Candidatus Parcubacteria bacterium]|nr:hypothetical protein [Candidatus Parcubacteria bacterium]